MCVANTNKDGLFNFRRLSKLGICTRRQGLITDGSCKILLIAGTPLELCYHNAICEDNRDGLKKQRLGNQQPSNFFYRNENRIMSYKTINTNPKYEITEYGEVRNKKTKRVLKQWEDKDGYLWTGLYIGNGKYFSARIHRLVLSTYSTPPISDALEVHHKDGNRQNNHIDNLEWVTRQENDSHVVHPINDGTYPQVRVVQMTLNGDLIKEYESLSAASKETGCGVSHISQVIYGKRYSTGGYLWKKVEGSTTNCKDKCSEMENLLKSNEDIV